MISNIRYPSFKKAGWITRGSVPILAVGTLLVGATIVFFQVLPAVWFSAYLIYGLVRPVLSAKRRRAVEEGLDSEEEPESD